MSEHVAILVVHGIGEERPYGTLDQFTRGLLNELDPNNPRTWTVTPDMETEPDPTWPGHDYPRVALRIAPPPGTTVAYKSDCAANYEDITLFEYYWSPITKNKIKYTTSLLFLIQAGLQPFKYLAANTAAISTAGAGHKSSDPADRGLWVFLRELWRQAMLFTPLLLLFVWLLVALSNTSALCSGLKDALKQPGAVITAVLAGLRLLYLYTNLNALTGNAPALLDPKRRRRQDGLANRWWWNSVLGAGTVFYILLPYLLGPILLAVASLGSHLLHLSPDLTCVVSRHTWHPLGTLRTYVATYLTSAGNPWVRFFLLSGALHMLPELVLFLWLAWCVRYILVNYIGDIAVYANPNELSENYAARAQVLKGCTEALARILQQTDRKDVTKPRFDRVLVAGHSLGSVIAYDTLNSLLNRARTGNGITDAHLKRLRGLVTFGSPLNKIYYFFRELDDPKAILRHRTLDLLHAFRLKPSLVTNLPPIFQSVGAWAPLTQALEQNFTWINAYSLPDPVSGRLTFYDVGHAGDLNAPKYQKRLFLGLFGAAHLKYWSSPDFYEFVRSYLL